MAAGQQVLDHGHLGKQFAVLERARHAEPRDLARRAPGDRLAAKADSARPAIDAADAVEHAGLAGAVRADQRKQLALLDAQRDAVEHLQAAEAQAQRVDFKLSHTISGYGDTA